MRIADASTALVASDLTTYQLVTLSIAVAGFGLALLSLGWQAATFLLSGSRVRVTLQRGALGAGHRILTPVAQWSDRQRAQMAAQGITDEVVAIEVRNRGRLAINVESISAYFGPDKDKPAAFWLPDFRGNEPLPFRLEPGSSRSWAVPLAPTIRVGIAAFGLKESNVYMTAGLGNGKTMRTKERTVVRASG